MIKIVVHITTKSLKTLITVEIVVYVVLTKCVIVLVVRKKHTKIVSNDESKIHKNREYDRSDIQVQK